MTQSLKPFQNLQHFTDITIDGISDAFHIIYGDHNIFYKFSGKKEYDEFRLGAADLFIVPLIASGLIEFGFPMQRLASSKTKYHLDQERENPVRTIIGCLGIVLQLPRLVLACSLTALVTPIIAGVHIIKYPYVEYLKSKFFKLEGEVCSYEPGDDPKHTGKKTLGSFVNQTESRLNHLYPRKNSSIASFSTERLFFKPIKNASPIQEEAIDAGKTLGFRSLNNG